MPDYAIISEKGTSKDYMEDTYYVNINTPVADGVFAGVYDGHKGGGAAVYAKDNLHKFFFKKIKKGSSPEDAFRFAYQRTSEELRNSLSGTTAVNFYIVGQNLYWANAGDSRLLLVCADDSSKNLSVDHRIKDPGELERVMASGGVINHGYVMKGSYGIEPTRSLGDHFFESVGVLSDPSTGHYELSENDKWILAGSDGLFDFASDEEIAEIVSRHKSADKAAEELRRFLLEDRGGKDNLTFILMRNSFV